MIKILTYNISHECMSIDSHKKPSGTGQPYAEKNCMQNNINICKENVKNILGSIMNYDIIGLQEASKYGDIIQHTPEIRNQVHVNRNMSYIHSLSGREDMITFINVKRFRILAAIPGHFHHGKPFQIIFLQERETSEYFIIMNIHNCKNIHDKKLVVCTKQNVEEKISKTIDEALGVIGDSDKSILNNIQTQTKQPIENIIKNKNFNTIILGDFNDLSNGQEFWKKFRIFRTSKYKNLKNITLNTIDKPPKTCCFKEKHDINALHSVGDYISIDTTKLQYVTKNTIYNDTLRASDHLPVYAVIELISNQSQQHQAQQHQASQQRSQQHQAPQQHQLQQQRSQQHQAHQQRSQQHQAPQQRSQQIHQPRQQTIQQLQQHQAQQQLHQLQQQPYVFQLHRQQQIHQPRQQIIQPQTIQPHRQQQIHQPRQQIIQPQTIQPPRQQIIQSQRVIQPQIQPQTQPPRQSEIYYSQRSVTLRLFNDSSDPNEFPAFNIRGNNNIPINFRGKTIDTNTELIFPNGKKYKGTLNNYTCVMVKNSPYIIGYINCKYIRRIKNTNEFQLFPELDKKILRLIPSDDDPRRNLKIRGLIITKDDILIFPNGHSINSCKIIPDNINPNKRQKTQMILVQDRNNPEKIGYIKREYLIRK